MEVLTLVSFSVFNPCDQKNCSVLRDMIENIVSCKTENLYLHPVATDDLLSLSNIRWTLPLKSFFLTHYSLKLVASLQPSAPEHVLVRGWKARWSTEALMDVIALFVLTTILPWLKSIMLHTSSYSLKRLGYNLMSYLHVATMTRKVLRWEPQNGNSFVLLCFFQHLLPNKYWEMNKTGLYTGLISGYFCLSCSSLEVKQNILAQLPAALQIFTKEKKRQKVLPLSRCNSHLIYRTVLNIYNLPSEKTGCGFPGIYFRFHFVESFLKETKGTKRYFYFLQMLAWCKNGGKSDTCINCEGHWVSC